MPPRAARRDASPPAQEKTSHTRTRKPQKSRAKPHSNQTYVTRAANLKRRVEAVPRHIQALHMRRDGHSYDEIAAAIGVKHRATVRNYIVKELNRTTSEAVEDLRKVEDERLNVLWRKAWKVAESFHPVLYRGRILKDRETKQHLEDQSAILEAVNTLRAISERRAKLWGLDAPTKIAPTTPDGQQPFAAAVLFYVPANGREVIEGEQPKAITDGNNGNGNGNG